MKAQKVNHNEDILPTFKGKWLMLPQRHFRAKHFSTQYIQCLHMIGVVALVVKYQSRWGNQDKNTCCYDGTSGEKGGNDIPCNN